MRVSYSKLYRKLTGGKIKSLSHNGTIYFMDEQDHIIGRLHDNNIISLFVTDEKADIQVLNLVYNFKYKCNQDVIVADVAFTSPKDGNKMPIVSKNRAIKYAEDTFMLDYEIATCGEIRNKNNTLSVTIPMLNAEDSLTNAITEIVEDIIFYHLITRTVR